MPDPPSTSSPISQLLHTLGLTRDDLHRHSDQMRQFLTAEHASTLGFAQDSRPTPELSQPSSSSSYSRSISRSASARDTSPPSPLTPVKSEPVEQSLPPRHFDSMEVVIERQSRQSRKDRKSKKGRERSHTLPVAHRHPPSPSHTSSSSHPSFSLDSFMQSRDVRRVSVPAPSDPERSTTPQDAWAASPTTPQRGKYYRNHSANQLPVSQSRKDTYSPRQESPSSHNRSTPRATSSALPSIPYADVSPLPPSSPPGPFSSPLSSPVKIINTVSSPGPMDPLPLEEDYDDLPYTLPPGPYATSKPDLSYAALVGQAILSSPQHRLTLQEIYDWITIVYPYFQRGETTWMNSIRHVLSTTACFRKVVRDRSIGRTQWAIWDEDLLCFQGGGFKKQFCRDMENKGKVATIRKRSAGAVDGNNSPKKAKRTKKDKVNAPPPGHLTSYTMHTEHAFPLFPHPHHAPLFPPIRPMSHHQPYYENCFPQPKSAEVIFPPLPPAASYGHPRALAASVAVSTSISGPGVAPAPALNSVSASQNPSSPLAGSSLSLTSPQPPEISCPSSIPSLTPNRSSSTSPSLSSEAIITTTVHAASDADDAEDGALDGIFNVSNSFDAVEPGITLLDHVQHLQTAKGKSKRRGGISRKKSVLPPMPTSPTLGRKSASRTSTQTQRLSLVPALTSAHISRRSKTPSRPSPSPCTPSPTSPLSESSKNNPPVPTTPPRRVHPANHLELSPVHTPLSHRGLHMSPSASLAHYKSHLDPPPAVTFRLADSEGLVGFRIGTLDREASEGMNAENVRTPLRKRGAAGVGTGVFPPITPKRLLFSTTCNTQDSPLRTPSARLGLAAVAGASSPLRTPGSRGIFDPHDPGALLDEELSRLGAVGPLGFESSPAGLYGRGAGGLLYESPNVPSPTRWTRWW